MPNNTATYKVFISCPSDVTKEKYALIEEINKYNKTTWKCDDISVETVASDDINSEFGDSPQDIINNATKDKYDVYIGIMGSRFGTATKNAGSGTEEEFNLALEAKNKAPDTRHVAFFFKDISIGINESDEEFQQFAKVRDFKNKMGSKGLYKQFNDEKSFVEEAMVVICDFINKAKINTQYSLLDDKPCKMEVNKNFKDTFLNNPEADITNGHVESISLSDIYVPLDFRVLDQAKKNYVNSKKDETVNSELLFHNFSENIKYLIIGDSKSGKTSFCKMLFLSLHKDGLIPIFINGVTIKKSNLDEFKKKIKNNFLKQYQDSNEKEFNNISKNKIVIIIDDLQNCTLNIKYKTRLLKEIANSYNNVVCSADEAFYVSASTSTDSEHKELFSYRKYEIREAGHQIRFSFIDKWNSLGVMETINKEDLDFKNKTAQKIIDSMIGAKFIPSKPLMILVLLQAMEAGNIKDFSNTSLVRYYQYLIDSHLLKNIHKDLVEIYYEILPEIAYAIFSSEDKSIENKQLKSLIGEFGERKGINSKDMQEVEKGLMDFKVLEHESETCYFKQPYAYYYFLSDYLHKNFSNATIKEQVENLCQHLYIEKNANIIIFLSYHTNDSFILEQILNIANTLFTEEDIFDFKKEYNSPINKLISEAPKMIIDHENSDKNYKDDLGKIDKLEEELDSEDEYEDKLENYENINDLQFPVRLNVVFKICQIIGQLLQNHHVKLDKEEKIRMCKSVYELMLRCLNFIISDLSQNIDNLIADIKEI